MGLRLPPNSLPWRPVELDQSPSWLAHWQLNRLGDDGPACRVALSTSHLHYTPQKDRRIDDACGFTNVVRTDVSPIAFNFHPIATCDMTAALYWFQTSLETLAQKDLHSRLIRIDQLGTFACRNVDNLPNGSRSQHAIANAIDIAGFRFTDGRVITVAHDYGRSTPEGHFLDGAHDEACRLFNAVLGPRYDRLHMTNFHLDMGPYRICS
jgi:hypothetical protein